MLTFFVVQTRIFRTQKSELTHTLSPSSPTERTPGTSSLFPDTPTTAWVKCRHTTPTTSFHGVWPPRYTVFKWERERPPVQTLGQQGPDTWETPGTPPEKGGRGRGSSRAPPHPTRRRTSLEGPQRSRVGSDCGTKPRS